MFRRLLSYFFPITIYQRKSAISKSIEVNWNKGELVVDSKNTNYSYGSLQNLLRSGLQHIGYQEIQKMTTILVLGVGGGSVIKTLIEKANYKQEIIGVEIDADMIKVANDYFDLDQIPNLTLVHDDAFEYVLKTKKNYDLIIVDVFEDTHMPNFLYQKFFMDRLGDLLGNKGYIIFNTILLNEKQNQRNEKFIKELRRKCFQITTLPRIEKHNELIIVRKNA